LHKLRKEISLIIWLNIILGFSLSAQSSKTFDLNVDKPLGQVLTGISNDNDILFAYPTELISQVKVNNIHIDYNSNAELVQGILQNTKLEVYMLNDQHFLLREKKNVEPSIVSITGFVVDGETGEGLPYATIYQEDYSSGVFTDENGSFSFNVDEDSDDYFIVSFLGYQDFRVSIDDLKKSKPIQLKQASNVLDNVMITYVAPPSMVSGDGQHLQLGNKLVNLNTSGIMGADLLRNIQMVAGISAHEDDMATLKIRGSNAEGSKILLDGIPLYNVNHYYGIFSNVNSQYIERAELYKNAQPSQYKDASGGLLVLSSNNSDIQRKNIIDVNLLTASAYFENQLTDKIKFTVAGRSSYRNVGGARLFDIGDGGVQQFVDDRDQTPFFTTQPNFKFYDVNGSIKYRGDKLSLSGNVFSSRDEMVNAYDLETNRPGLQNASASYFNFEDWTNIGFSLLSEYKLEKDWILNTTVFTSHYNYRGFVTSELIRNQINQNISNNNAISLRESGVNVFAEKKTNRSNILGGFSFNNFNANHKLDIDDNEAVVNYNGDISYITLFGEYEYTLGKLLTKVGMRMPFSKQRDKFKFFYSPLISTTYNLSTTQKIKASYNYSNQIVRELEYENRLGQNYSFYRLSKGKNFPVLKTHKFMLGYTGIWDRLTLDIEAYYKSIKGAMQLLNPFTGFDQTGNGPNTSAYQLFTGDRRVKGIDVTIGYQFDKLYSALAYTLSKSEDKYNGLFKGQYFLSQNDRRHQFKWINNLKVNRFDFNFNIVYANGRPYIPFENLDMISGKDKLDPKKNQKQLPAYYRVDIGGNYAFNISKVEAKVGLSIFNLFNRQNVKYVQYSHSFGDNGPNGNGNIVIGTGAELLDRTLNLNFNISF